MALTKQQKDKLTKVIESELGNDPAFLYDEIAKRNLEQLTEMKESLDEIKSAIEASSESTKELSKGILSAITTMDSAVKNMTSMAAMPKLLGQGLSELSDAVTNMPQVDFSSVNQSLQKLHESVTNGDGGKSHNKLIDTLIAGFKHLEDSHAQKTEELKIAFKEANQPLIDQNVEKLSIMKSKKSEDGKQNISVSGGGAVSSMILRGFGAPKTLRKTSTSPGTPVQIITTSTQCRRVDITALPGNQSPIWYGDTSASAVSGSEQGTYLSNTNTATLNLSDVSSIYFDVGTSGDGVTVTYYN